jgi:hypothetical protein
MQRIFLFEDEKQALTVIFATAPERWSIKPGNPNFLVCELTRDDGYIAYNAFMQSCCSGDRGCAFWRLMSGLGISLHHTGINLTITPQNYNRCIAPYLGKRIGRVIFKQLGMGECYFLMSDLYPNRHPATLTEMTLLNIEKNYDHYTPEQLNSLPLDIRELMVMPAVGRRFSFCSIL